MTANEIFFDKKKKEKQGIIQPSFHFYGIFYGVKTYPFAEEWHGCYSKKLA